MGMSFELLYKVSPFSLKATVDRCKKIGQSKIWHPEGNVYIHTKIVTNRLFNKYNDINLTLAGYFHDLGKIVTTIWNDEKNTWTSPNHENMSILYVELYSEWIKSMGGDVEIVTYIVKNHMKIKYFDEMSSSKKRTMISHKYFEYLLKFNSADYGGVEPECKEIERPKLKLYKKKNNIIQRIFDKFYIRGRIFLPLNNFYLLKTKKPFYVKVNKQIRNSKKWEIRI